MAHRVRQIGERDGVLGADVAAAAAVAAARAGRLLDAGGVDVGLEADGDRRRDDVVAERRAGRLERLYFGSSPARGSLCGRSHGAARRKPSSSRPSCAIWPGQRSSAKTRASGRSATPALISDPPPSPQPTSTCMSSPRRTSNSAEDGPVRRRLPVTCISFLRSGKRLGNSPVSTSRPRSSTATVLPARASREAATPPP